MAELNRNTFKYITIILFLLLNGLILYAANLEIVGIDDSAYPEMKAYFFVRDHYNKIDRDISPEDIELTDNNKMRDVKFTFCTPLSKYSSILTIDISYSMRSPIDTNDYFGTKRIDLAREGAELWVDSLPVDRAECGLTTFNYETYINEEFTTDKDSLRAIIEKATSNPIHGTNYNGAFLFDNKGQRGALQLAKSAKYKPILIFLTDGEHDSVYYGPVKVKEIIDLANKLGASIYCITIGMPMPQSLKTISEATNGRYYEDLNDRESVNSAYMDILKRVMEIGTPIPCEMTWDTDCSGGFLHIKVPKYYIDTSFSYTISDINKPNLQVNPSKSKFVNVAPGSTQDAAIKIKALNKPVEITGADIPSNYEITDWGGNEPPFTLNINETRSISIKYNSLPDSAYHESVLSFKGDFCSGGAGEISAGHYYPANIYLGISDTNRQKEVTAGKAFCNYSGSGINISGMKISGPDASEFRLAKGYSNLNLPHDSCLDIEFLFTPKKVGIRKATLEVTVNGEVLRSEITGIGAGKADIGSPGAVDFGHTGCSIPYRDTTVRITNIGVEDLVITGIKLEKSEDFALKSGLKFPITLKMLEYRDFNIRFIPVTAGLKNETLIVESNALAGNFYRIPLNGFRDSLAFESSSDVIDLGILCPGAEKDSSFTIQNTGNAPISIVSESEDANLAKTGYNIPSGGSEVVNFNINDERIGSHESEIILKNEDCGLEKIVKVRYSIEHPGFTENDVLIVSKPDTPRDTTLIFTNNKNRSMVIDKISFDNSALSVRDISYPITVEPGGTMSLPVTFYPMKNEIIHAHLIISGEPCGFIDSINVIGNSTISMAEISVDNMSGLIGQEIDIPVRFGNSFKFPETKTSSISFDVSLDNTILETVKSSVNNGIMSDNGTVTTLSFRDVPVNSEGKDQELTTFRVTILKSPADNNTGISLKNASSDGKEVYYIMKPGVLSVLHSSADIYIDSANTAAPGEIIEIPVRIRNAENFGAFHTGLNTTLVMNATLLSPVGNIHEGEVTGDIRKIDLKNLPVAGLDDDSTLTTLKFRAMLGNALGTDIRIMNTSAVNGQVDFREESGYFRLKLRDTTRLFDPFVSNKFLSPFPNPTDGRTVVRFELADKGRTRISLWEPSGRLLEIISDKEYDNGFYEEEFNAAKYSAGLYYLEMRTPSQVILTPINIIR